MQIFTLLVAAITLATGINAAPSSEPVQPRLAQIFKAGKVEDVPSSHHIDARLAQIFKAGKVEDVPSSHRIDARLAQIFSETSAGANPSTPNPRLAQFRVFGEPGCNELNYGFFTVDRDQTNVCHRISGTPTIVASVNLEVFNRVADGCTLRVYQDFGCNAGEQILSLHTCSNPSSAKTYGSWKMECP